MTLDCILDTCPAGNHPVDMRRCCDGCKQYGAEPWSEFGSVTCKHPNAKKANAELRSTRSEAFQATAGIGHLLYTGNRRRDWKQPKQPASK